MLIYNFSETIAEKMLTEYTMNRNGMTHNVVSEAVRSVDTPCVRSTSGGGYTAGNARILGTYP